MLRDNIQDLIALAAVAEERSFTRAAARLGVSQSALSHTIKNLESRIGIRLLTRTTRSVAPTLEGEDLLATLGPCFEKIETRLCALADRSGAPSGTVRIAATDYSIETLLWPKLSPVLKTYPDVRVEFHMEYGYTDLAETQCDAGVRYGGQVNEGMISVQIGPDERMACVAAPSYIDRNGYPKVPQDLTKHKCIMLRVMTHGALYAWEFEDSNGQEIRIKVTGQTCFNTSILALHAARDGHGFLFVPRCMVTRDIANGSLVPCLEGYLPFFLGQHLYYPSRQRTSSAFQVVLDALRHTT